MTRVLIIGIKTFISRGSFFACTNRCWCQIVAVSYRVRSSNSWLSTQNLFNKSPCFCSLQHLAALMITSQLIGQVTESLIPYVMFRSRVTKVTKEGKKIVMKSADLSDIVERQATQEQYLVGYHK